MSRGCADPMVLPAAEMAAKINKQLKNSAFGCSAKTGRHAADPIIALCLLFNFLFVSYCFLFVLTTTLQFLKCLTNPGLRFPSTPYLHARTADLPCCLIFRYSRIFPLKSCRWSPILLRKHPDRCSQVLPLSCLG